MELTERQIKNLISELETLENGNNMSALEITGNLRWQQIHKARYQAKAEAYRFVIRKIQRTCKIKDQ